MKYASHTEFVIRIRIGIRRRIIAFLGRFIVNHFHFHVVLVGLCQFIGKENCVET